MPEMLVYLGLDMTAVAVDFQRIKKQHCLQIARSHVMCLYGKSWELILLKHLTNIF